MKKFLNCVVIFMFALVPANLAVAAGGTVNTLDVTETSPGVISISGSVSGIKEAKITIARSDGEGEAVEIITMVDGPTNTYAAVVDTSSAANNYTVTVVDNEGGDAKSADISVSSSENISTPDTNVSNEAVTANSSNTENTENIWGKIIPIIAISAAVVVAVIAVLYFFVIRRRRNLRHHQ
ncbi:hypothetical protein IJI55_00570 [Candidatus Saccharibacteria bacterium]|nr:hypothetical protein [Candidatus Saccharibacteria bacterium]